MSKTLRDLIDDKAALEALTSHRGWLLLMEYACEAREEMLTRLVDTPCVTADQVYAEQFIKGRCSEIKSFGTLPLVLVDNLTIDINSLNAELEQEHGRDANPDGSDPSGNDAGTGDAGSFAP